MANATQIQVGGTNYNVKDAQLQNAICPLFISSRSTKTALFKLEAVEGTAANTYIYTITANTGGIVYAFSEREVGTDYHMYTLQYEEGCNNVGTDATHYKFDRTITSSQNAHFNAFVCDRSDFTMKIIPTTELNENHRVIAMFYNIGDSLLNNFTAFGTNDVLFVNMGKRTYNKIFICNIAQSYRGALTWSKDANNVYTITRNLDYFAAFGVDEQGGKQIGIGSPGVSGVTYPFPESISSSGGIGGYAFIVCDPADQTTSTWQLVSIGHLNENMNKYLVLGFLYNDYGQFFTQEAEMLFTNFVSGDNYKVWNIAREALYWGKITSSVALASGKVNFDTTAKTVTITKPITAPNDTPGTFWTGKQNATIVLDFSTDAHPSYLKCIYFDNVVGNFVVISGDTPEEDRTKYRNRKNSLALLCIVYNTKYVFTASAVKNTWFLNGRDIYGTQISSVADLYKTFKKVAVIGDSLSVGYMMNKTTGVVTSRMLQYSWVKRCMADAGGVPWLNLGTSGQSVLTWCSHGTYGKVQAEASGNKCQAYIIGLGENDQSNSERGIPLGTAEDIVDDYTHVATTYYGGYARIIQILKHLNPTCKIFCLTNPRTGGQRAEYNEAVRYIAGTYYKPTDNVFLVDLAYDDPDLFNGSSFLPVDSATITGGHYSAIGYTRIATIMETAIMDAMQVNQEQFVDIPYIPYDTGAPTPNTMTE